MISERGKEVLAETARRGEEHVARMIATARSVEAGGRPLAIGSPIVLILEDGAEIEANIVQAHEDGTVDALAGPDVLIANRPPRLDRLAFGRDWRWPAERPSPATSA